MTIAELDELLTLLRRHGVTNYACDALSIELGPLQSPASTQPQPTPSSPAPAAPEDDLLMWSTT